MKNNKQQRRLMKYTEKQCKTITSKEKQGHVRQNNENKKIGNQ